MTSISSGIISQHYQQPHSVITPTMIKSAAYPWYSVLMAYRSVPRPQLPVAATQPTQIPPPSQQRIDIADLL